MKNQNRKPQINFEAKQEFIEELKQISSVIEVPVAQIAREAIREKIAKLREIHPALKQVEQAEQN